MNPSAQKRYAGLLSKMVTFCQGFLILLSVLLLLTALYYYVFGFSKGFEKLWMTAAGNMMIEVETSGLKAAANAPVLGRDVFGMMIVPLKISSPFLLNTHFIYFSAWLAFSFVLLRNIKAILRSVGDQVPFDPANGKRIRLIGLMLILITLADSIHMKLNDWWMGHHALYEGMSVMRTLNFSWSGFFAGLILLLLAEVFRYGLHLQEEQDLTV